MNCGPSHVWTSSGTSTPVTGDPCDCGMARWSGDTPCHCPFCPGLQAEVTRLTALLLAQAEEPPYLAEANQFERECEALRAEVARLTAALAQARREALEEAVKACRDVEARWSSFHSVAALIPALEATLGRLKEQP